MCFKIGDKVAVLDDPISGTVVSVSPQLIGLKDASGMLFEYPPSDLVKKGISQSELSKFSPSNRSMLEQKKKAPVKKKSLFVTSKNEVVFEVDLHIQQLVSSTKGMDNYDMLSLQLDTAKRKLDYAIQKRFSKIIFIHGVGEGVLKGELDRLLNQYPVRYYDASFQKYGRGATEVYIFQNKG